VRGLGGLNHRLAQAPASESRQAHLHYSSTATLREGVTPFQYDEQNGVTSHPTRKQINDLAGVVLPHESQWRQSGRSYE